MRERAERRGGAEELPNEVGVISGEALLRKLKREEMETASIVASEDGG